MDAMVAYSIPVQGLKTGIRHFNYALDHAFFRHFEGSPIEVSEIKCTLQLDKRPDMMVLDFELDGWIEAVCDRCTAIIHLPVQINRQLVVKFSDEEVEAEDEVVFIQRDAPNFKVDKYLYEFSVLAMPITNVYDCENDPEPPCNQEVLKYLSKDLAGERNNSAWDVLKDLNKNKKK